MKHINITIFGKVQNVGFRFNAKKWADSFDLTGFVKNRDDGSVYIEVEGEAEALGQFENWCEEGSAFSRVKRIKTEHGDIKDFDEFEITY